jgi:hypothetical protein
VRIRPTTQRCYEQILACYLTPSVPARFAYFQAQANSVDTSTKNGNHCEYRREADEEANAKASSNRSLPQNISGPTKNVGAPNIPLVRASSV